MLVELFTSQGCSSCPSADAFFNSLDSANAPINSLFLAHHVNYWNGPLPGPCGTTAWVDPYSSATATSRQQAMTTAIKGSSYLVTPQFIIQGQKATSINMNLNGTEIVNNANSFYNQTPSAGICIDPVAIDTVNNTVQVQYTVVGTANNGTEQVVVAVYEDGLSNYVSAGENCTKTLHHNKVVRTYQYFTISSAADTVKTVSLSYTSSAKDLNVGVSAFIQNKTTYVATGGTRGFTFASALPTIGVNELENAIVTVNAFPNPAKGIIYFTIEGDVKQGATINIYNITGALLKKINVSDKKSSFNLEESTVPAGVYMYVLESDDVNLHTGRFVVE